MTIPSNHFFLRCHSDTKLYYHTIFCVYTIFVYTISNRSSGKIDTVHINNNLMARPTITISKKIRLKIFLKNVIKHLKCYITTKFTSFKFIVNLYVDYHLIIDSFVILIFICTLFWCAGFIEVYNAALSIAMLSFFLFFTYH